MEEAWYCLYWCYGLCLDSGSEDEMKRCRDGILEKEKGEAGQDGRQLKFYCLIKKEQFVNFIGSIMK